MSNVATIDPFWFRFQTYFMIGFFVSFHTFYIVLARYSNVLTRNDLITAVLPDISALGHLGKCVVWRYQYIKLFFPCRDETSPEIGNVIK